VTRWGGALLLGAGVTAAASAFGSPALGLMGIGLLLAGAGTRAWVGLARTGATVEFRALPSAATEGDSVRVSVVARRESRVPVGSAVVAGTLGGLGPLEVRLRGSGRAAGGQLDLGCVPRGVYRLDEARIVLGDFLGLVTVCPPVRLEADTLVVRPRLSRLDALFSDAGRFSGDGRRLLLRSAGFDFHSVREYEQGESLRRVHWPTSARRGQLMVKELEDRTRDGVVVLLDCDPRGIAGKPPDSSFDASVRAAGSLLAAHAGRGRATALVTTGSARSALHVSDGDLDAALVVLAAVEPDAAAPVARALAGGSTSALRAGELVVVTAMLDAQTTAALLDAGQRQLVSVVWVDAPSYVGHPTRANPNALRLAAAGVPVAAIRCGDDLAAALGSHRREAAVGG